MAKPLTIIVKEDVTELKKNLRKCSCNTIKKRIKMLLCIKQYEPQMLSQKELATKCKCAPNSINDWRKMYLQGGIDAIMQHNWTGSESRHITKEQYVEIDKKLSTPNNGLVGYTELLNWVETNLGVSIKYTTLYEYIKRNFKTKIKVARKSHIKKNEAELEAFKKKCLK